MGEIEIYPLCSIKHPSHPSRCLRIMITAKFACKGEQKDSTIYIQNLLSMDSKLASNKLKQFLQLQF